MSRLLPALIIFALTLSGAGAESVPPRWSDGAEGRYSIDERERIGRQHLAGEPNYAEAVRWYRSAAEGGSRTALAYMGWFYEEGRGVARDGERAVRWYRRAVEAGEVRYSLHLAWIHMQGELVEQNRAEADRWFRYGIARDMSEARLAYGSVLYADLLGGHGDEETGREAERLLLKALEDGQMYATRFLSRMYLDGTGVERDVERGLNAVRLGADTGDVAMQILLAQILAEGRLVEPDLVEANTWATLAAAQGDETATELRGRLEQQLDREQITESRERAVEWASAR
ncbi:MAG: tetratricopeptide repeat protein [Aquisalimonadaceae bacterium]